MEKPTWDALALLRNSGVRLYLVTGRELPDFEALGTDLTIFDLVVAENGAVLYDPHLKETQLLGTPPGDEFLAALDRRNVPYSKGACIVATREPHEVEVFSLIRDMGLELQVIFNKGAVMILPSGVNKATGLTAALKRQNLASRDVVGVGDAENDHAFLEMCGLPAAVANALPSLKQKVAWVSTSRAGAGVSELIHAMVNGNLDAIPKVEAAV